MKCFISVSERKLVQCRARATALEKALDHILNPLLTQMETYLTKGIEVRWLRKQGTEFSGVADITWETATLTDVVSLASVAVADLDPPSLSDLGRSISNMLNLLQAICLAGERMEVRANTICPFRQRCGSVPPDGLVSSSC
jgi:hypothetical protein